MRGNLRVIQAMFECRPDINFTCIDRKGHSACNYDEKCDEEGTIMNFMLEKISQEQSFFCDHERLH
jgi:hypothetical protein